VRILFLSTSMGMGGADQQLLSAAMGLRHRGHEVRIVSLTPLGEMGARARAAGLATESLEMRRGIADPRGLARLVRLVRSWHPRVLHSHMLHANLMARAVRLFAPCGTPANAREPGNPPPPGSPRAGPANNINH